MIKTDYIGSDDSYHFRKAHESLILIPEQTYQNLYQFLECSSTSDTSELREAAMVLRAKLRPTRKVLERDLAGTARKIFETPAEKKSYDQWLKQQSTFQPVLDEADKL